ncbi:MAG: hypothetical protein Q9M91_01435 [Candidatus Dojkabacteria bacterium]|nr:hypothetical protein [Candidatus Dojkabacteria bacterium]
MLFEDIKFNNASQIDTFIYNKSLKPILLPFSDNVLESSGFRLIEFWEAGSKDVNVNLVLKEENVDENILVSNKYILEFKHDRKVLVTFGFFLLMSFLTSVFVIRKIFTLKRNRF